MAYLHLAHTLADAFNALADEVQTLTDRKTVLEHKLRFAHEQVRKPTRHISLVVLSRLFPFLSALAAQAPNIVSAIPERSCRAFSPPKSS
jgi:predicted  nucleic acid-binding Zn-ribbon protein